MAGRHSASRRAIRRKEYIGFGLPPREYGSTPKAVLPPLGIKPPRGSLVGEPAQVWTRIRPIRRKLRYLMAFRSACNWASSKPLGAPLAVSQSWPSSVWASSQYFFQKASVMVFNWPQVMQVKPCWSYLGTKTQCPPQLPFLALAPPWGTTSHTS